MSNKIKYIALGDSYTICDGMLPEQRWPNLLANDPDFNQQLNLIANPSVTGWTSQQLIDNELPLVDELKPEFVTLLIGTNDWVQEVSEQEFERRYQHILQYLLDRKIVILAVNIPDFSLTTNGPKYSKGRNITTGLKSFNDIIQRTCDNYQIPVADIFRVSTKLGQDPKWEWEDGLHPSALVYPHWYAEIKQFVQKQLNLIKK